MENPLPTAGPEKSEDPLAWLLPFRWAVAAIEAVLLVAAGPLGGPRAAPWAAAVPIAIATTNLAALALRRHGSTRESIAGSLLVLDAALLTALFAATGGAANPFTIFYLVLIAFSALVLRPVWTWATALASLAGFSLLFALPGAGANGAMHDHGAFSWHLRGMWAAFAAASVATALFVTLLRQSRDRRERELARLRDLTGRFERLAALSTFAASAAHELATPLGTIAIAAERLESGELPPAETVKRARAISAECARGRTLLDELAGRAGEAPGEAPRVCDLAELAATVVARLPPEERSRLRVVVARAASVVSARAPERALERALGALVRNAIEASPRAMPIEIEVSAETGRVRLRVLDRGSGPAPEIAARVGEPFLTTKGEAGLGLGLFLAARLARELGGDLRLAAREGGGSVAALELPRVAAEEP